MRRLSDYTYHGLEKKKKDSYEHIFFIALISLFFIGIIGNLSYTGRVAGGSGYQSVIINEFFNHSVIYNLTLQNNATSIRLSGEFIGNGSGKIYVNDVLVVDSKDLIIKDGLITGFVVFEENQTVIDDTKNETDKEIAQEIVNETMPILFNETISIDNETTILGNESNEAVINESIVNETSEILLQQNETIQIAQNMTANLSDEADDINGTSILIPNNISDAEISFIKKRFSNYCLDSCSIKTGRTIVLKIELDDVNLNLTDMIYGFRDNYEITYNETFINQTLTNITFGNLTANYTLNISLNISINATFNITLNGSIQNISLNLTNITQITQNMTFENLTLVDLNLTINGTDIITELFNLTIFNETESYMILGINENNFVKYLKRSDAYIGIRESDDIRIRSKFVILENIDYAEITLEAEGNSVLECIEYDNSCKRWKKTDIVIERINGLARFNVTRSGVYSIARLLPKEVRFIPASSVYMNSNCDKCLEPNTCEAEGFCVVQNKIGYDFEAQLNFDILNIKEFDSAQVCAFVQYLEEPVMNYLVSSKSNYCSGINNQETEDIISYSYINSTGWICIDATDIALDSFKKEYSNTFINWIGQDIDGAGFPFSCYWAITNLTRCDGSNPSGAKDCRPYLRLEYR